MRNYESAYEIHTQDYALAREFSDHPLGSYSPEFFRLLHRLPGRSLNGKLVLSPVCYSKWGDMFDSGTLCTAFGEAEYVTRHKR